MGTILPVLRRSAMQTATSCLYRYNQIWNLGTPDASDLSMKGIAVHSAIHRYIMRLVKEQLQEDHEEAKAAFVEGIAAALTPAHLVAEVREIFFGWAAHFGLDLASFVAAEEHQVGGKADEQQQTFTPDLVYARPQGVEIKDFKTSWHPITEEQIRQDFQCRFYVYNAMRIWKNFPSYTFTHCYVRFGVEVSATFQPSDLATFGEEVGAIAATITEATERNEWPATAGTDCAYCQLKCPLQDHPAILTSRLTVAAQAQLVGAWVLANDVKRRIAMKALKAYASANGAITVGGMEFDNRPVLQRSYPMGRVIDILKSRSLGGAFDADSGLTISHSALADAFKDFPQLEQDLLPYLQSKTTWRFSAKKPGIGDEDDE